MEDMIAEPNKVADFMEASQRRRGGGDASLVRENVSLTDIGNAVRFARDHAENVRYCDEWKKFLTWDGARWQFDVTGQVWRNADFTARGIFDEAARGIEGIDYDDIMKFARASCDAKRLNAMVALAKWQGAIPVRAADFDKDPFLFNTLNGTVNLLSGEVRDPLRADLLLKRAPVTYDPDAKCARWLEFLNTIFKGDEKLISFVRRAAGYSLCGSIKENVMFILYGTGTNGKTTLIETLQALTADYGSVAPIELLLSKKNPTDSERLFAPLAGVRFLSVTEPEERDRMAIGRIKRMTGGDTLAARYLYGEMFKYRPQFKIWLLTNHPPNLTEVGPAAERRLRLIPFLVEIQKEKIEKDLQEHFTTVELPGIFNWALAGARAWQEHGLGECEAISAATAEMFKAEDIIGRYIEECCTLSPLAEVGTVHLYKELTAWCKDNREYPPKSSALRARLRKMGMADSNTNGRFRTWKGIALGGGSTDSFKEQFPNAPDNRTLIPDAADDGNADGGDDDIPF